MRVPTTTNEHPVLEDSPVACDQNNVAIAAEVHPTYSCEATHDGYEYEQKAEIEEQKGYETFIEGAASERLILPTCDLPGYASESIIQKGLQVPDEVTVTKEAEMKPVQWTTTVGKGLGTFFAGGIFFGFLGVIPAALVGRKVRQSNEEKNFVVARQKNVLHEILNRWHEAVFKPKGLLIRVDLPSEAVDISTMDLLTRRSGWEKKPNSGCSNSVTKQAKAEGWVTTKDPRTRSRAANKGRIVILPLSHAVQERDPLRLRTDSTQASSPEYHERPDMMASYADEKRGDSGSPC